MLTHRAKNADTSSVDRWFGGSDGAGHASAHSAERSDTWVMARAGASLFAAGATLGLLWLALPHPSTGNDLLLVLTFALAYAGAGVLWFHGDRFRPLLFDVAAASGTVLITCAVQFSGRSSTPFVLFYLWSNLYAWYFFPRRRAAIQLGLIGLTYAGALASGGPFTEIPYTDGLVPVFGAGATSWIITLGTLLVTGLLVMTLRERVDRLLARVTEERNFVSSVVNTAAALVVVIDTEGRVQSFNPACQAVTGFSFEQVRGRPWADLIRTSEVELVQREWPVLLESEASRQFDAGVLTHEGGSRDVAWSAIAVRGTNGEPDHVIATGIDITERKRSEHELRKRLKRQAAVAELGRRGLEGLSLQDLTARSVELVAAQLDLDRAEVWEVTQFSGELLLTAARGWDPKEVGSTRQLAEMATMPGYTLQAEGPVVVDDFNSEERFSAPPALADAGITSCVSVTIPGPRRPYGVLSGHSVAQRTFAADEALFMQSVAQVLAAAIERWRVEESIRHNALHDPLTGLPNRTLFLNRLAHVFAKREATSSSAAVMFLDIDNFKLVNDSLGHEIGDRLLRAIAPRLSDALRPSDTLARFGGDEFVVLCEEVTDGRDALQVAERLQTVLAAPFDLDGEEHVLSASIGVALANGRYATPEEAMRDADAAMYRAKERGRANCELFDDAMRERALGRLRMENALRGVVERDELCVYYQPVVSIDDGATVGVEALLRWQHSGLGPVSPLEFIPIAEDTGLIIEIGRWVLEEVCHQAVRWEEELGENAPVVSVNLSPRQVAHAELVPTVARVLEQTGLDPERLALEITENVLITEADSPWNTLQSLKRLGVKLMLDDFGTGYSSLSYLKRFPVDVLKIDRTFVDGLGREAEDSAIVEAVIGMARTLDLGVIAEGVETLEQAERLRALGCERAQGFWYGRPRPAAEITPLLRTSWPERPALIAEGAMLPSPRPVL
jgi:diguanylate cyclase (GGDEF)-like protein/PAS domain S-box-containing protein